MTNAIIAPALALNLIPNSKQISSSDVQFAQTLQQGLSGGADLTNGFLESFSRFNSAGNTAPHAPYPILGLAGFNEDHCVIPKVELEKLSLSHSSVTIITEYPEYGVRLSLRDEYESLL